jgi:hypothetical protein
MGAQLNRDAAFIYAYMGAVCSASLASIALLFAYSFWSDPPAFSFSVTQVFGLLILFFVVCSPITAAAAIGPFLVMQKIADAFSIRNPWYFIVAGTLTGLLLSPFAVYLFTRRPGSDSLELYAISAGAITPGGTIGGLVYWLMDGRHLATETLATPGSS